MIKAITTYFLGFYFLLGAVILPLGDFALIKDLPKMYRAYEKVASPDERGILDFVGDYLLNGKIILGHNKHDGPDKSNVQYQHAANFCSFLINHLPPPCVAASADYCIIHTCISRQLNTSDYYRELFKPPLSLRA